MDGGRREEFRHFVRTAWTALHGKALLWSAREQDYASTSLLRCPHHCLVLGMPVLDGGGAWRPGGGRSNRRTEKGSLAASAPSWGVALPAMLWRWAGHLGRLSPRATAWREAPGAAMAGARTRSSRMAPFGARFHCPPRLQDKSDGRRTRSSLLASQCVAVLGTSLGDCGCPRINVPIVTHRHRCVAHAQFPECALSFVSL